MEDGSQADAVGIPVPREVRMPRRQPRIDALQEGAGLDRVLRMVVDLERGGRMQRRLNDPRRLDVPRGPRSLAAAPERRTGEVRVVGHAGVEDDVRDPAIRPLAAKQLLELLLGTTLVVPGPPDGDERRVPAPLMRVEARGRDGRRSDPVGLQHLFRRVKQPTIRHCHRRMMRVRGFRPRNHAPFCPIAVSAGYG